MALNIPLAFELEQAGDRWLNAAQSALNRPSLGTVEDFVLEEEVLTGGQGLVFRARDRRSGELVAIKRLRGGSLFTRTARERLYREILAVRRLHHPLVVRIYGLRQIHGESALIMQWIEGQALDDWGTESGDGLPAGQVVRHKIQVFLRLCGAVQHAHRRAVVHGDLKPSNVIVSSRNQPHLLDFGLARFAGGPTVLPDGYEGTPEYSAPERLLEAAPVSEQSDQYALGVLLYELLTGTLPLQAHGDVSAWIRAWHGQEIQPPSERASGLARNWDAPLLKALHREPTGRYDSVAGFAAALRTCLNPPAD